MGSGLSSLLPCRVGLALGELLLCIPTLSFGFRPVPWLGELHFSLKGSKGFLSCGRANPNTGDVVPEPQPTQLPVPTLPRESPYHPSNPQEPPYRV